MSDAFNQAARPQFDEIKNCAADWLWRQQGPDWSEADRAHFDVWLAQSRYHLVAYWRLKAAWDRAERLAALKSLRQRPLNTSFSTQPWFKSRFTAAVCIIAAVAVTGTYLWSDREVRYVTALGQRATITLADGSQVELNTNSAISVNIGVLGRRVRLTRGEAFFKVRHDASRPFAVLAAGHRVTDLGTQFSVRTSGNLLEVTLVEGRARLEADGDGVQHHATDLTPGEVAIATPNTISVSRLPMRTIANTLAWRSGKIVFSHITLAEAAAEFNRYNGTKLIVEPDVANLKVSGTFDAGSVGPFTAMARLAFGLQIQQRNHAIIVSRQATRSAGHDN